MATRTSGDKAVIGKEAAFAHVCCQMGMFGKQTWCFCFCAQTWLLGGLASFRFHCAHR